MPLLVAPTLAARSAETMHLLMGYVLNVDEANASMMEKETMVMTARMVKMEQMEMIVRTEEMVKME